MRIDVRFSISVFMAGTCLAVGCGSSDESSGAHGGSSASGGKDGGAGTSGGTGAKGGSGGTGAKGGSGGSIGGGGSGGASGGVAGSSGSAGSTNGGGTAGVAGAAGSPAQCASGDLCVPTAPSGWSGPATLVTATGGATPMCAAEFPTLLDTAYTAISAPPATCECAAAQPGLSACRAYLNLHTDVSGGICYGCSASLAVSATCTKPYWPTSGCSYVGCVGMQSSYTELECQGVVSTSTLPSPTWGNTHVLCGGTSASGTCNGGSCLPSSSGPFCIFRDGSETCPPPFTTQQTLYRSFADTRACGCSTAFLSNACAGTLQVFADENCATTPVDPTGCATINCPNIGQTAGMSAKFTASAFTKTCPVPTSSVNGSLTETEPVTVCCTG